MISIIVPVYNAEKYLKNCINSLINQSYNDIEIILVNDGSEDSSGVICDEFKNKDYRIKVIHKENGGVSSARNAGLDIANGEYIMFCDSDDVADKDWCLELVKCAIEFPGHLPVCGLVFLAEGSDPEYRKLPASKEPSDSYRLFDINRLMYLSNSYLIYNPVNKIYRSDIIKKNNMRFDTDNSLGEDAVFNMNYLYYLGGHIAYIDKILYSYYDVNPNSLCKADCYAYAKSYESIFNAYNELFTKLDANTPENIADLHSYHYKEILSSAILYATDKSMAKKARMKAFKEFIYLPAFNRCRKKVSEEKTGDRKLFKLSKFRPLLMLYILVKEIL
ncbi:MAG: glycosyltransferase family 2 protein [Clostridia bacterium]|nr:glycosyltransferase family 2 protein [Clostridia bacterium]